jgi:RimJ/RimL family protein N-acetyltransferase
MRSVVQYGFDDLALAEIVGVIVPENQKSVGLSEKCEFRFWKRFLWEDRDRLAYRITREDVRGGYA